MEKFVFSAPTEIVFGKDAELQVAKQIEKWNGSRVLIVYGSGSVVRSGLLAKIEGILDDAGMIYKTIGGVKANPVLSFAENGVKEAVEFGADFILAVGGGSVIDTAKGIAIGSSHVKEQLWDIWSGKVKVEGSLPVGVVLTISAAGSETSTSAVLTNEETGKKSGCASRVERPKFAIMNPELTYTVPRYQIACGIVDIMMHTLERYFTTMPKGNQMTDEIAEGLLRTVIEHGRRAYKDSADYEAMSELMWCGSLSHNDITGLGRPRDFTVHKFGHELSAKFDTAHGASLSVIWATWARHVCELDYPRFQRYARKVWGIDIEDEKDAALAGIEATEAYFKELEMPICLGELEAGVLSEEIIRELADRTTNYGAITIGNFKKLDTQEVYEIYKKANHA